jgi:hypothetical protein
MTAVTLLREVDSLSVTERDAMHELLQRHFDGVTRSGFERDLSSKTHALLLTDRAGSLTGFSTLRYEHGKFAGATAGVVWSGDTIVDPTAWRSSALSRAWIRGVMELHGDCPDPLWWLLICSGFRTYRFLPLFFRQSWPRRDAPLPQALRPLRDALARHAYGTAFDPCSGIVQLPQPQRLRSHLGGQPEERAAHDEDVAFFLGANPGHADGDELVCLARILPLDLSPAGQRMTRA